MTNSGNIRERKVPKNHLVQTFCFTKGEDVPQKGKDSFKITHLLKEKRLEIQSSKCHPVHGQCTMTIVYRKFIQTLYEMEGLRALNWELEDMDPAPVLPSKLHLPLWVLISPPVTKSTRGGKS